MNSQLMMTCGVFSALLGLAFGFYKHTNVHNKIIGNFFIILLIIDVIVFVSALSSTGEVNLPPKVVSLMPDKMNPEAGTTINWTATALDPENDPVQYKFLLDAQQIADWSYDSTWCWPTSSVHIGSHTIIVKVKDGHHNASGDDFKSIDFSISPDATTWSDKGDALSAQGKYDDAINAYYNALDLDPQYALAWSGKGQALYAQGKYDEAINAYDEAIRLDPNDAEAWSYKGDALHAKGKYDEAIEAYDEATRLNHTLKLDSQYVLAWSGKGQALYAKGKYDEAINAYDEAIRLDPNDADAWSYKGDALRAKGKYDEAIEAYDEAIRIDPENATWFLLSKNTAIYDKERADPNNWRNQLIDLPRLD